MPSRNLFRVLLSIILLFSAAIVTNQFAVAQTPPADQSTLQELDLLNTAIADIEAWLSQANADRPQVETQLESIEQQISTIIQQSNTTNSSINQIEKEIEDLNLLTDELTLAKQQQTEQVNQVVRAAYIDGQQSNLKLLLNQQDPVLAMRMLHYYQLYNSVKIQQIENFQNTLEELAITQEKFQQQTAELALQQEQLLSQQAQLDLTRVKRQEALDQLVANIGSQRSELEQLLADRNQLEQLIEQINIAIETIPVPQEQIPFADLKGYLPRPGAGSVVENFGANYGSGDLQRQGIVIATEAGSPVYAVHNGRIVFSDWLRGYGLLVIIDHGDGHMSLYGRNDSLLATKGSVVSAGEIIANAGNSGGFDIAGIYFEIRVGGDTQNPQDWLLPPD